MDESKVRQCRALLKANEDDTKDLTRYRTTTARLAAATALRMEREVLLVQLELMTGEKAPEGPVVKAKPKPDDPREPVKA